MASSLQLPSAECFSSSGLPTKQQLTRFCTVLVNEPGVNYSVKLRGIPKSRKIL